MSISSFLWGSSQFDESVDKATSELLPSGSEDIGLNLEICDLIRSKNVTPSAAMKKLKSRLNHPNPNVQILALSLTDTCIKNGGDPFLAEITSREFIDNIISILKQPALNGDVKRKILYYIQSWALSLEGKATMGYLGSKYKQLQSEGFEFPPRDAASSSAMVETQVAPEWIDSDVCLRCRTAFTLTNRKHHCRNCGQVFDQQCSSKTRALPHFGISAPVRVCDSCFTLLNKGQLSKSMNTRLPTSNKLKSSRHRSLPDYDEALQRAIRESLAESQQVSTSWTSSEPPLVDRVHRASVMEDDDPELRAAIEESLRDAQAPRPSAPPTFSEERIPHYRPYSAPISETEVPGRANSILPNYDLNVAEMDDVLKFTQAVDDVGSSGTFSGRYGHDVSQLLDKASRVRPKMALSLDDTHRKQQLLIDMNHKISEVTKLYDQLLDRQLSHTRWRLETPAALNNHPIRNDGYAQSSNWHPHPSRQQVPDNKRPVQITNQPQISPEPVWNGMQNQSTSQPWPGSQQQQQPSNISIISSPVNQLSPQSVPVDFVSPIQYQTQAPAPQTSQHQIISKPPTASPALTSHRSSTFERSQQPAITPTVRPIVQSPPSVYIPQTTAPLSQQTAVPLFPAVPQTEPHLYETYNSHSNAPEPERREALLIDL